MFAYYLNLALRSFKRNKVLTALMVLALGLGIGASITTLTVLKLLSGDPLPHKNARLFHPEIDPLPAQGYVAGQTRPPSNMSYMDAMHLLRAHKAERQAVMARTKAKIKPLRPGARPFYSNGVMTTSAFFAMFDVPFQYGSGWSAADDKARAQVAVISTRLNDKLFGGGDSVGKTLNVDGHGYRVVGVLDRWHPQPVFYDVVNTGGFSGGGGDIFIPFTTAIALDMPNTGNTNCNAVPAQPGFVGLQKSERVWISFMVQLDGATAAQRYKQFLHNYAAAQQQAGRFNWPPNVRLRGLMAWLSYMHVVPPDTKISLYVALGLLLVCLVNVAGLLLAKFMRRGGEIGVRRALGASRREVYTQFLIEAGIVGLAGGVFGVILTALGVAGIGWVMPPDIAALAQMNVSLLVTTLIVAIVATMLAGLYPTMRAAAVQPAWQLKSN